MTIRFHNVRKLASHAGSNGTLLHEIEFCAEMGRRIGILGAAKSGKSTMLRLMCGTEDADGGVIERSGRISWPIPLNGFLAANSTVAMNIRFAARIYGVRDQEFPRRIAEPFDFAEFLNVRLKDCPKFVRPRLALSIPIGIGFDIYLFDNSLVPVDKEFKDKGKELFAERAAGCGYVLATSKPGEVEENVDSVYVLDSGRARYFSDAKAGIEYFKQLLKAENRQPGGPEDADGIPQDDDDDAIGDIDVIGTAVASVLE